MKKFIKTIAKGCLFLLPVVAAIWIYIWLSPLNYIFVEKVFLYLNNEFRNTKQPKYYDVVLIGDSRMNRVLPNLLSESTINLSVPGSSIETGYYVLNDYLKNNAAPKVVYMHYFPPHLNGTSKNWFWERAVLGGFISCDQAYEILDDNDKNESKKTLGYYREDWRQYLSKYRIKSLNLLLPLQKNALSGKRKAKNMQRLHHFQIHKGAMWTLSPDVNAQDALKLYDSYSFKNETCQKYFQRIVKICEENNIILRIIGHPDSPVEIKTAKARQEFLNAFIPPPRDKLRYLG